MRSHPGKGLLKWIQGYCTWHTGAAGRPRFAHPEKTKLSKQPNRNCRAGEAWLLRSPQWKDKKTPQGTGREMLWLDTSKKKFTGRVVKHRIQWNLHPHGFTDPNWEQLSKLALVAAGGWTRSPDAPSALNHSKLFLATIFPITEYYFKCYKIRFPPANWQINQLTFTLVIQLT